MHFALRFMYKKPYNLHYIFIFKKKCTLGYVFISKSYRIVLIPKYKPTYDQSDQIENKFELFIENWSYSYDKSMIFDTYHIMRE